jgi:26S proteasome regulatory subunit T1
MPPKADWEKYKKDADKKDEDKIVALDEGDIQLLKTYGQGPYAAALKALDNEIKEVQKRVNEKMGVKESDTGLAPPNLWDLKADEERMRTEQALQVARCTKIIKAGSDKPKAEENGAATSAPGPNGTTAAGGEGAASPGGLAGALGGLGGLGGMGGPAAVEEQDKYVINVKQIAKFVVALGDRVAPTDIEEGMRVGVDRNKYQIQIPLPPKIDPSVTMMQVEEKPDVTYGDVGGCKEQIEKLREVVETPLLAVSA